MTSVGSLATNFHEGSRSEYLAQYVLSSFGTAVPVPHQEDTGLDIYCTLLERDGPRAWPRAYYSVQVKSTVGPWIFDGAKSVSWIIEHPLPNRNNELVSAAIYATALRRLSPDYKVGEVNPHNVFLHRELNRRFGMNQYLYEAANTLLQSLIDRLAQHGISDSGQSPQRDDPAGAP